MAGPLLRLKQQFFTVEGNRKLCILTSQAGVATFFGHKIFYFTRNKWCILTELDPTRDKE